MVRILKRPMFRRGGMPKNQGITAVRPEYMGGGMTGIMSGIIPRPDAGLTPRVGYANGPSLSNLNLGPAQKQYEEILRRKNISIQRPEDFNTYYQKTISPITDRYQMNNEDIMFPEDEMSLQSGLDRKIGNNKLGLDPDTTYREAQIILNKPETKKIAEKNYLTNIEKQKAAKAGVEYVPKQKKTNNNEPFLETTSDTESDLMRAYKEYAPIFEKELGVSPEDTKKSLYLQLAKFGAGLAAQPGGDLVGAIGKAAMPAIEGAGATVKDQSTAKRQAKLLALQTAIKENEGGPLDKTLKTIAKAQGYKGKDKLKKAYEDYTTFTKNDTTAKAAETKRYADQAKVIGLEGSNQNRYINESKQLASMYPNLVGNFNEQLPDIGDLDEDNVGAYYVSPKGQFVRVVKKDGEIEVIGMDEPGFKDKAKEK
tara:strand:+ start:108 stop:1382 length:1275 start_codon:yes stop_codon:yes gene_type:complete